MEFNNTNLLIAGNSHKQFSELLAEHLNTKLCNAEVSKFNNGEIKVIINQSIRKKDCFIIQPTSSGGGNSPNDNLMEIFILIDALKRGSANSVTIIMPYYGYERQDRKDYSRAPISATVVSKCLEALGADRVVVYDLHAGQIQGFFSNNVPLDHLYIEPYFINYIKQYILSRYSLDEIVIVAPDEGAVKRAVRISTMLKCGAATIFKERSEPGVIEKMTLMGEVNGKIGILVDDIIDTAGTACKGAETLKQFGCKKIFMLASHGILSDPATDRINNSCFDEVIVTNTVEIDKYKLIPKIKVIDVSWLAAQAILKQIQGDSLQELFNNHDLYKIKLL